MMTAALLTYAVLSVLGVSILHAIRKEMRRQREEAQFRALMDWWTKTNANLAARKSHRKERSERALKGWKTRRAA